MSIGVVAAEDVPTRCYTSTSSQSSMHGFWKESVSDSVRIGRSMDVSARIYCIEGKETMHETRPSRWDHPFSFSVVLEEMVGIQAEMKTVRSKSFHAKMKTMSIGSRRRTPRASRRSSNPTGSNQAERCARKTKARSIHLQEKKNVHFRNNFHVLKLLYLIPFLQTCFFHPR